MSKSLLQKLDRERSLTQSREVKVVEQLCRISLAADAPTHLDVEWCEGLGKKTILYVFEPGGNEIVWPLNRAIAYCGPFTAYEVYEKTTEEKKRLELRDVIVKETARFMDRYDYPREEKTGKPTGQHRAPRFKIEVITGGGEANKTYFLPEIYGYHEFDDIAFDKKPSVEEIEAHYQAQLSARDAELEATRREVAEIRGMVLGQAQAIVREAATKPAEKPGRRPHKAGCKCVVHRNKAAESALAEA